MDKKFKIIGKFLVFLAIFVFALNNCACAYVNEGGGFCSCNSCSDCQNALNDNVNCINEVELTADILGYSGSYCINSPDFNNKIFDCKKHTIAGTGSNFGIYMNSQENNTIKNCVITGFGQGITLGSSSNNNLIYNNVSNNYRGIKLDFSSNNNSISFNLANNNEYGVEIFSSGSNALYYNLANNNYIGFHIYSSSGNNIISNIANFNDHGFWLSSSSNNEIKFNTGEGNEISGIGLVSSSTGNKINQNEFCSNLAYDLYSESTGNSGDNNICGTNSGWNDAGTSGCTYSCPKRTIYGYVTDEVAGVNVPSATITLYGNTGSVVAESMSHFDGYYKFQPPIPSSTGYCVNASKSDYISNGICGIDFDGTSPIEIDLYITACTETLISGVVIDNESNVISGVLVTVYSDGFQINSTTDTEGKYRVTVPNPDNYTIIANASDIQNYRGQWGIASIELPSRTCNAMVNFDTFAPITIAQACDRYCSSCSECAAEMNAAAAGETICLNQDINHPGDCIYDPANFNNKVFDCRGHIIKGDNTWMSGGIYLVGKNNITIKNCTITNFTYGIYLYDSLNCTISSNTISNNEDGISLYYSSGGLIINNIVTSNGWDGIYLGHSSDSEVVNNIAINNGGNGGGNGIVLNDSSKNRIAGNTANSNTLSGIGMKYSLNNSVINNTANSNTEYGFILSASSNNSVINNTAESNIDTGIYLMYSLNNSVINNTAESNKYGIYLYYYSGNNVVTKNTANSNNYFGIILSYSSNNSIINNTVNSNNGAGIILSYSSNNSIINNTVNSNNYGLFSENSSSSPIINNKVNSNNYGISIFRGSNFNEILDNEILDNTNNGIIFSDCGPSGTCYIGNDNNALQGNLISNSKIGIYSQNSNTTIGSNIVCNNSELDFKSPDWKMSYGTNNSCDNSGNWTDQGIEKSCTFRCGGDRCDFDNDYYVKIVCGGTDCNDLNSSIHPTTAEIYCNAADENCDGKDECICEDGDGDGVYNQTFQCPIGSDCDDNNNSIYPGALEIPCNGIDEDCNGFLQCGCVDNDHDGYNQSGIGCGPVDCNDYNINIHPNAQEIYCNGENENCNPNDDCVCYDNDNDGFYLRTLTCPSGIDCNDNDENVNPFVSEICYDNIDNNCNGMTDENCIVECTSNGECKNGEKCIDYQCACQNGNLSVDGTTLCDPVGFPDDTPCTYGWPSHQGNLLKINEWNYACDLFEVTRTDLLGHAEKARDCCKAMAEGNSPPECHDYAKIAYLRSGLNNALDYNNLKRCIGLYEIYGNGPGAEFMQNYFYPEICCSGGFGFSKCYGHIGQCSCNQNIPYSQNATILPCGCTKGCRVGQPDGWASDTDMAENSCRFSDLPAHASINIISTGTCVDYSIALTTLLRISGYDNNEIYSITGPGHEYNLIKFPGDAKYTLIDTVGNYAGYHPNDLPGTWFSYCDYYSNSCTNDKGTTTCPIKNDVLGCIGASDPGSGTAASPLNNHIPSNFTINSTSTTYKGITATRTVYESVYIGEVMTVNMTLRNDNAYPINVTIDEVITNAEVYRDLIIPNDGGLISTHLPYIAFNESIPSGGEKSIFYKMKPLKIGDYVSASTEIYTENISMNIDTQTTKVKCISNGVCDGSSGENYISCPHDCKSGAEDGICNPVVDMQCDKDCIDGLDSDCENICYDLNDDGIIIHDWNDLMIAYKCFLGINKNCNDYYQDWNLIKREYNCFTKKCLKQNFAI